MSEQTFDKPSDGLRQEMAIRRQAFLDSVREVGRGAGITLEHRDGIAWHDAPIPRRWHRCWVQTSGMIGFMRVDRCACGAVSRDGEPWFHRNERRRS